MKTLSLRTLFVSLALVSLAVPGAEPAPALKQISQPEQLDDFAWVAHKLVKEPAYKSAKVRYNGSWVIGDGKKSVMTMVWDESGGTGKGYDTYYFDTNFDGDLTAPDKHFAIKEKLIEVGGIKEADGQRMFTLKFVPEGDNFMWQSSFSMSGPNMGYQVGLLPGNLKIQWSNTLKDAPVYHLGGPAVLRCAEKYAGASMGEWMPGRWPRSPRMSSLAGSPNCNCASITANRRPGGPQISLRVPSKTGAATEDIPFTGGCGCAGSFNKELLIPSRVPPGAHTLVVRLDRAAYAGGPAEFLFSVDIANPDYGKPLLDPAFQALKTKYPSSTIASLRRAAAAGQDLKGFPDEFIVPVQVFGNMLYGRTRDGDMSNANMSGGTLLALGKQIHHEDDARTLLKFDLATLPKDAEIVGAQLRLTVSNQPFTGSKADARITAFAVKQEWSETESSWNFCRKAVKWAAPGCDAGEKDRASEPAASADIANFPEKGEHYRFVALDLTDLAKKWRSGEWPNNGVLLKYSGGGCVKMCNSEFQDYPFRPTLVLALNGGKLKPSLSAADGEDLNAAKAAAKLANKPLVVRFYSPTCGVCRAVEQTTFADSTVKAKLASDYQYVSVKIEDQAKLAQDLGVGGVPAVVMLKPDGQTKIALLESETLRDKAQFLATLAKNKN